MATNVVLHSVFFTFNFYHLNLYAYYIVNHNYFRKKSKRWYVRLIFREKPIYGQYSILQKEHQLCNSLLYFNYMRMDPSCFEELLTLVGPKLLRSFTRPDCLSIGEILSATIRLTFMSIR